MSQTTLSELEVDQRKYPKKAKPINQHEKLKKDLLDFIKNQISGTDWNEQWDEDLPKKWKICKFSGTLHRFMANLISCFFPSR
jgi:hypothetical protein